METGSPTRPLPWPLVVAGLEPLLPSGTSEAYVMTHLCPPLPAWDHLTFFPDGMPVGHDPTQRMINYERE